MCEYMLLVSLCCSGAKQEMKISQRFRSARLKQLSQRPRAAKNGSKVVFFKSFTRDSRLRTSSSDTETVGDDEDRLIFSTSSIVAPPTPLGRWVQRQRDLQRLSQPYASNSRPEHFLEVIILFDVRCLLFPSISILSKRHPTKVMRFATLQLRNEKKRLKTPNDKGFSLIRLTGGGNQNNIT